MQLKLQFISGAKHKWYENPEKDKTTYWMIRTVYDGKIIRIPEVNFVVVKPAPRSPEQLRKDAL